jgi:CDP-glucose 4,6-dehydratase
MAGGQSSVESMELIDQFWKNKRVLLTGHTGFKGAWMSLWLHSMGAKVQGFALPPPTMPSLFEQASLGELIKSTIGDLRDFVAISKVVNDFKPEIVFHMAAQPLVRYSYDEPLETYATNVMGTVHLLESLRTISSVRAVINVTTDKCYENREWVWGYREEDAVGGYDPYSSSKACSELVTAAYRQSFFDKAGIAVATARAGNVIGGGDWAKDRLVPDILRAFEKKQPVSIRNPNSVRPWQHVLEPLSGYLRLAEKLWAEPKVFSQAWNFGPKDEDAKSVAWIVEAIANKWGKEASWTLNDEENHHETNYLKLDISKVRQSIGWSPRWTLNQAIDNVVEWQKNWLSGSNVREQSFVQIAKYLES